jgi:hypothetical protein
MSDNERILCSAVWFQDIEIKMDIPTESRLPVNCDRGLVVCGHRHYQCLYTAVAFTGLSTCEMGEYVQGFLTNRNRFVDREEGGLIHRANGHSTQLNNLFSEDLY